MHLDIVIPAHNEQHRIGRMLRAYRNVCTGDMFRFVVAMDRCTDATAEIVRSHIAVDPRVRMIEFGKLGKGGVLMEAFRSCDAGLIGFVDADCATPPAEFMRLVDAADMHDGAIATRHHHSAVLPAKRPMGRRVTSAGFAMLIRWLFDLPHSDTQCGAKVIRREVLQRVVPLMSSRDFLFDVDLLVTSRKLGFDIVEVPTIWIDQRGSRVQAARDAVRMAASALRLWLHHKVIPVPDASDARPPEASDAATLVSAGRRPV